MDPLGARTRWKASSMERKMGNLSISRRSMVVLMEWKMLKARWKELGLFEFDGGREPLMVLKMA